MANPLPPNSRIGIIGAGQLGMYLAQSAQKLGFQAHIYSDSAAAPACSIANATQIGAYDDAQALHQFAQTTDCLTYEFENISSAALEPLGQRQPLIPPIKALRLTQDRWHEKQFCQQHNIPTGRFANITTEDDLTKRLQQFGGTGVLKTRRFGYDGKGQWRLGPDSHLPSIWQELDERPAILESLVPFEREVSLIGTRFADGYISFFDMAENVHRHGILHTSQLPASLSSAQIAVAQKIARQAMQKLDYIGVLTIEFFACEGTLLVNEFAPRVHNSGHWSLDSCATSQFEQHIRALAHLPAGDTTRNANACMTNLLGDDVRAWQDRRSTSTQRIHIYGKSDIRDGRKMGHVTQLTPLTPAISAGS